MNTRLGTTGVGLVLLLAAAHSAAAVGVRVAAVGPAWQGGGVTLSIQPEAVASVPRIRGVVLCEGRVLDEVTLPATGGQVTLSASDLRPGRHQLTVKLGSAAGATQVRVLPRAFGPLAAAVGIVALWLASRLSRSRPRRALVRPVPRPGKSQRAAP